MDLQIISFAADQVVAESVASRVSRPFDVYRWGDHKPMASLAVRIASEINAVDGHKRNAKPETRRRRLDAIRALVTDCIVAMRDPAQPLIGVSLDRNAFRKGGRLAKLYLTFKTFVWAFEGLARLGYIEVVMRGFYDPRTDKGHNTKIRGTAKLMAEADAVPELPWYRSSSPLDEAVLIRGPKPKRGAAETLDPRPDQMERVAVMQAGLDRLNDRARRHWVDLEMPDAGFIALARQMAGQRQGRGDAERAPLDLSRRTYRRIFNNGTLEDGGRLYGPWWQGVPKEFRRHITIDGLRTVELDFSGMHPRMLYAQAGLPLPDDPYSPEALGIPDVEGCRDMVKRTFNAMLNAVTKQIRKPANFHTLVPDGVSWAEFKDRIAKFHEPIAQHFYSGAGLKLQAVDAEIAVNVMGAMHEEGMVVLGVHDSFIVQQRCAMTLRRIMQQEFERVVGAPAVIKETKYGHASSGIPGEYGRHGNLLEFPNTIAGSKACRAQDSGYQLRQRAWWTDARAQEIRQARPSGNQEREAA